jgi:hypothetical protein
MATVGEKRWAERERLGFLLKKIKDKEGFIK